jgi:hypothetical protein
MDEGKATTSTTVAGSKAKRHHRRQNYVFYYPHQGGLQTSFSVIVELTLHHPLFGGSSSYS